MIGVIVTFLLTLFLTLVLYTTVMCTCMHASCRMDNGVEVKQNVRSVRSSQDHSQVKLKASKL